MGRLFWKIFAGFWLTLLLTVLGIVAALTIRNETRSVAEAELAQGPRSEYAVRLTWLMLRHGGQPALDSLLGEWPLRDQAPPLAVLNASGADINGREVPAEALRQARLRLENDPGSRAVRSLQLADGREVLVFLPAAFTRAPAPRPPWPVIKLEAPLALALAALLASLGVSALLARHFSRPIRDLRQAFRAASHGQLGVRVGDNMGQRRDEIGELGREFDSMAQQLQQLMGSQHRLLHDVSHELRSPLARLQVAVGLARQKPDEVETALTRIERETERLNTLVGEILSLSRLEAQQAQSADEYVDLVDLIDSVVEDARFEAEGSGRHVIFTHEIEGELIIRARGELLHRAIDNIVRNALRHTPETSTVSVSLAHDSTSKQLRIRIQDAGPGVPEAELDAIFEPFHRGDTSSSGYGLGLAIARRAVQAHGGELHACNREGGGLEVVLALPHRAV